MADQNTLLTGIYKDIKNDPDIGKCASNLDANQLKSVEDSSHRAVIESISNRASVYFSIFGLFNKANANLQHLKAGDDITLETLVSFGLAVNNASLGNPDPKNYAPVKSIDLIEFLVGSSDFNNATAPLTQLSKATNLNLGSVIKKINDLAFKGAETLKVHQSTKGTDGFNINFFSLGTHKGLPFGMAAQGSVEQKFMNALSAFLNNRINLALEKIKKQSEKQAFKFVLFKAIADASTASGDLLKFLLIPGLKPPPILRKGAYSVELKGETKKIGAWLATTPSSALGFDANQVLGLTKTFLQEIVDTRLVINNEGDTESYRKSFTDRFKRFCEQEKSGNTVTAEDAAPFAGSELELKRRRLQNIRCVLPLFEDLYSSTNSKSLQEKGLTGVYSSNYKHTLNSSLSGVSTKTDSKFFTQDQHPLLFVHTRDSHFFINKLFNRDNSDKTLKTFLETTNTDISFLQPRIRIYKVLESQEGKEIEIPIEFSNKIELTKASGVYERENAGIERVRIRRTGQTPATFDKLIDVNVRFVFDSINAFTKCRTGGSNKKYSYVDLLRRPVELRKSADELGPLVGRIFANGGRKNIDDFIKNTQEVSLDLYSPDKFQIKLEVGWSYNEQVFRDRPLRGRDRQRLENFINETNLVLYLHLQTHDFTFRNDGTVNLDVRYMGRTGSQLIDAFQTNIFHTPNLNSIQKSVRAVDDILSFNQTVENNKRISGSELQLLQQNKNQLVHKLESERSKLTSQIWQRLVDSPLDPKSSQVNKTLLEGVGATKDTKPTHFLKLTIPQHFVFFDADASKSKFNLNLSEAEKKKAGSTSTARVTSVSSLLSFYRNKLIEGKLDPSDNMKLSVINKKDPMFGSGGPTPEGSSLGTKDDLGKFEEGDQLRIEDFDTQSTTDELNPADLSKTYLTHKNKSVDVYCMRYGSIVHSAIQNIWQFNPEGLKDIVIMMASSRFSSITGGKTKHFNFADVPILFEDWKRFMIDKTVNKKKVNYAFIDFLRDSMLELLIPAMGAINTGCKDGSQIASPLKAVKPRLTSFSARRQPGLKPDDGRISVNLDDGNASLLMGNSLLDNEDVVATNPELKHFLVIYDAGFSTSAELNAKGRKPKLYDKNLQNNIPHVFIGANKGIMRSISFRKSSVPFLQESKVLDRGDTDFGLLREKYDCTMEVIGNPHFHQGMRFYLDPTFTGMSSHNVDVVQGVLGLGGYYDIVDVTSDISNSGFKTNIVGSWQAFHDGYDSKKRHVDPCKDK